MKKNKWAGWTEVFRFTIAQNTKNKSFIISSVVITLVVALLCVAINVLPAIIFDTVGSNSVRQVEIDRIYIKDESGRNAIDFSGIASMEGMPEGVEVISTDTVDVVLDSEVKDLVVVIEATEYGYEISPTITEESGVSKRDANSIVDKVSTYFKKMHCDALGIRQEQIELQNIDIATEVTMLSDGQADFVVLFVEYMVNILMIVVFILLVSSYGRMAASAVAMEKSSKVIELLLTSVRPMATIAGKIIAMATLLTGQIVLWIVTGFVFYYGSNSIMAGINSKYADGLKELLTMLSEGGVQLHVSPMILLISAFVLITGFTVYITLASVVGATVSKIEELGQALQTFMMLAVVGSYLPLFGQINMITSGTTQNTLLNISRVLPISSLYLIPSELILGTNTLQAGLLALGINIVTLFVVIAIVSKIYESVILYSGNRLKPKDIIAMLKNR